MQSQMNSQSNDATPPDGLHLGDVIFTTVAAELAVQLADRLNADRGRHLRYLRSRLPCIEDAEDALQDATIKLIRHPNALLTMEWPEAWVGTSLRNTVIDRYRRAAAQRRLAETLLTEPPESTQSDEEDTATPIACLTAALPSLKQEYATVLRLVYLASLSIQDVAQREQISANNVGIRLHRARNAMRQKMIRQCEACPIEDCWGRQRFAATTSD